MQPTTLNRRKHRSENSYVALGYQLASSAKRANFDVLVLADHQGFIVASSGDTATSEEVAALSPMLCADAKPWHGFIDTRMGKLRLTAEPLQVQDRVLYLTASEGQTAKLIAQEMQTANQGIHRILQ